MGGSGTSTLFVNQTGNMVIMKVGNNHASAPFANIASGRQFRMEVNTNDTYREFRVGVGSDAGEKTLVVTSDECCDYQCITITESADGTLDLHREPRQRPQTSGTVKLDRLTAPAAKKQWFVWKMCV